MSPTELLSELVETKGQLAEAQMQQERSHFAVDQLMTQVEAKAAEMEEPQVSPCLYQTNFTVCPLSCVRKRASRLVRPYSIAPVHHV